MLCSNFCCLTRGADNFQGKLHLSVELGSVCSQDLYFSALEEVLIPRLILGIASILAESCT